MTPEQERNDLLEIIDDRHGSQAIIVASQLPIDKWHAKIGDPATADAILDRLFHNAHRIVLQGARNLFQEDRTQGQAQFKSSVGSFSRPLAHAAVITMTGPRTALHALQQRVDKGQPESPREDRCGGRADPWLAARVPLLPLAVQGRALPLLRAARAAQVPRGHRGETPDPDRREGSDGA